MSTNVDFFHCHIWFCKSQDCSIRVWDVAAASGVCNWPVARAASWQMLYAALAKVEVGESCFSCGVWTAMEPNSTVIFLEQTAKANWHVTVNSNSTREPGESPLQTSSMSYLSKPSGSRFESRYHAILKEGITWFWAKTGLEICPFVGSKSYISWFENHASSRTTTQIEKVRLHLFFTYCINFGVCKWLISMVWPTYRISPVTYGL